MVPRPTAHARPLPARAAGWLACLLLALCGPGGPGAGRDGDRPHRHHRAAEPDARLRGARLWHGRRLPRAGRRRHGRVLESRRPQLPARAGAVARRRVQRLLHRARPRQRHASRAARSTSRLSPGRSAPARCAARCSSATSGRSPSTARHGASSSTTRRQRPARRVDDGAERRRFRRDRRSAPACGSADTSGPGFTVNRWLNGYDQNLERQRAQPADRPPTPAVRPRLPAERLELQLRPDRLAGRKPEPGRGLQDAASRRT